MRLGNVVALAPLRNKATTTSSKDAKNANSAADNTLARSNGAVIFMNALTGLAPRLRAARSRFSSILCRAPITTMMTMGTAMTK